MPNDFHREQIDAVRRAMSAQLGCDPVAFDREELIVVPRPEPPMWPFVANIVGFGTGTVLCTDAQFLDWVKANAPAPHFRVNHLPFLSAFQAEARSRGLDVVAQSPALGWALSARPPVPVLPYGYALEPVDRDWMEAHRLQGVFHNGLGGPAEEHRSVRNRFAVVIRRARRACGCRGCI